MRLLPPPSLYYRTAGYYWSGGGTISMADPNPDLGPTTNKSWEVGNGMGILGQAASI